MTLSQLSVQYDASAALVAGRLAQLTARYYDRSFCGYGDYRI